MVIWLILFLGIIVVFYMLVRRNLALQSELKVAKHKLQVANHHLKELDKAKDEFISMASHQLRTPLTTIKGYISMMAEGDAGSVTPQQKEFLDYAFAGAQRMVSLISDLLNVSRLSAGRFMIEPKPTDLQAVIEDEIRQLEAHAAAKHLRLIFENPPRPLKLVELDESKTRQVIMNFIENAIYYTPAGDIIISLRDTGGRIELSVRDNGIGVPQAAQSKLFTKFYRADNAQNIRPDGTGLGLYLAKRVVSDQGGTILFESEEGHGSTFGFSLPYTYKGKLPPSNVTNPTT